MRRLRIAVSQRLDSVPNRQESRDCIDAKLPALLWGLGFQPLTMSSGITDLKEYFRELAPDGILLSGGNDIGTVKERDALEKAALDLACVNSLPVLGICRGMQFINHYQGGNQRKVEGHVAVTHKVFGPIMGRSGRTTNSYHNYGLQEADLGKDLEPVGWTQCGDVEAIRHRYMSWLGIMWHPERDSPTCAEDKKLIQDHFQRSR